MGAAWRAITRGARRQLGDYGIARGYAVASSSLNSFNTTCADVISAETMMMVKEHFTEEFGPPRWTIGSGRSGGSMQQHLIANNYPGLLDGLIPTAAFADTITFMHQLYDCEVLDHAFDTSSVTSDPCLEIPRTLSEHSRGMQFS